MDDGSKLGATVEVCPVKDDGKTLYKVQQAMGFENAVSSKAKELVEAQLTKVGLKGD